MKISTLLEDWPDTPDHVYRRWGLKLQAELIEHLPDDYDVTLTDLFLHAGQYSYGKSAVRVKSDRFKGVIANGEVLVFPRHDSCTLVYTYKSEYERSVSYPNSEGGAKSLADDLQASILNNTV